MATSRLRPLRLLCWEGYDHPSVLGPFTERTGTEVQPEALISDAATAARLAARPGTHDLLNINNAYVARYLHPAGLVRPLDPAPFEAAFDRSLPQFRRLYRWARSTDGRELIGVCQRFGAFNLVVNTRAVSRERARDEGFALAEDGALAYGILEYEDFNLFHVCIAAGIDPFRPLDAGQMLAFERTAQRWYERAALVSADHHALNRALVERRIDLYLSGGVYTASPVRLAGRLEVEAITPERGPINPRDGSAGTGGERTGKGGIVFTEITALLARDEPHPLAEPFLHYLLEPETAVRVAQVEGTRNPVAQMGDPRVMAAFDRRHLDAIQWDTLEEDVARCADYDLVPDHDALLERLRAARARRGTRSGEPRGGGSS